MSQLNPLVGEWIGQSTTYKGGKAIKTVPAFEKISYGLDGHILTIDLDSEALQLHTVIYYDETDDTFYYNPFYKTGSAKYRAEFKDGQLIVWPTETKRFIFGINDEGQFVEYGETFQNGEWTVYFKDVFKRTE
ncbi:hypothetical protein Q2T40_07200 [Winogradskyella maritima]|uniref:DUF1579 domain-containing protein n=1 Tax=Winogradskyella maritima TaxID=1517766 RepID=A0ABV8AP01_9FLAO|nr:hypothetical protein [Winogradskyella maritima]